MDVPESLPARLYLLAYDTERGRLTGRSELGYIMRAGALADLLLAGHLTDVGGKPRAGDAAALADPLLADVLRQIAGSRPRYWRHWVAKGGRQAAASVRDRLAAGGWIRLEQRRVLRIFPVTSVTVRDPRVVKRLADTVSSALRGGRPVSRLDPLDAALVALAAAGEIRTVMPRSVRRANKRRIAELSEAAGPVPRALSKAIQGARAAAAS
ncbi:GOLPH3/VPS74 family protein [Actinomadura scrupuli]|uniref:GOLPH3/VPS74 family protein n=1 Tax=Actinomadura scrupuli TaxID=559629 RepID=UPI003D95423C